MTKKATKISAYISLIVIPFGAATLRLAGKASHAKQPKTLDAAQEIEAPFRDGLYLGRLDAQDARKKLPSVGRWRDPKDRASFLAGYQRGYEEAQVRKMAAHPH